MLARDGVELLGHGAVDGGLGDLLGGLEEDGADGEEDGHQGRVSGQLRVDRSRVKRVHRHIRTFWRKHNGWARDSSPSQKRNSTPGL